MEEDKEKRYQYLFKCFLLGIEAVISLYEICRTGRKKTTRKIF